MTGRAATGDNAHSTTQEGHMPGIVRIEMVKDGKVIHEMIVAASLGFAHYAPGGVETFVGGLPDEPAYVSIPKPIKIDEVRVSWPLPGEPDA